MQETFDRIRFLNQAISNHSWRERQQYNRTIYLDARIVGNGMLQVNYSTLVNLFSVNGMTPTNGVEARSFRETIIQKAVGQARQAVKKYLEELRDGYAELAGRSISLVQHPSSEKFHHEAVQASVNTSVVQFRYSVYFAIA